MTDKNILDELHVTETRSDQEPEGPKKSNLKRNLAVLKRNLAVGAVGALVLGGVGFMVSQGDDVTPANDDADKEVKNTVKENQEDPFKTLSKAKAENVAKLDKAVAKVVTQKENFKPLDGLKDAEEALKTLDVKDADLQTVHEAYSGVIETLKDPNVENLQAARTSMANMKDAEISEYMTDSYSDKLVGIVTQAKLQNRETIEKQTKPLTPQQVQAKKDAKVKADKAAAEKAKADKAEQAKQQAESKAKQDAQREADRVAAEQAALGGNDISGTDAPNGNVMEEGGYGDYTPPANNGDGGYVPPAPPANNGGGGYVPPAPPANNGGGGYVPPAPPANNGGGASNNNDAQNAANNTPTPTPPPSQGNDISGTDAPNGYVMEPGGW